jgi:hypothetical protein
MQNANGTQDFNMLLERSVLDLFTRNKLVIITGAVMHDYLTSSSEEGFTTP